MQVKDVMTADPACCTPEMSLIDVAALMVANSWLGEHRKSYSRLYQKIREARSMNYGDYSYGQETKFQACVEDEQPIFL